MFQKTSGLKKLHRMVYHDFVENWFSHSREKFRRGTLHFLRKFPLSKKFLDRKGISRSSLETFLSDSPEKILSVTVLSEKISGLKKLHKMAYHDFVENWFSHSREKFRRGTLHFLRKFPLSKKFLDRRGISRLSLETFCLTVPKKFLVWPF